MRWLLLPIALAATVALVPSAEAASRVTIRLTSYTTITKAHDTKPKGKANKGDSIDFKDLLVNTKKQLGKGRNKPVGYDAGTVWYTSAKVQRIGGVATFPGVGTITFEGVMKMRGDGSVTIPVTGGTGQFKGAKGTLVVGKGDQKAPNVYRLKLPHPLYLPGSGVA